MFRKRYIPIKDAEFNSFQGNLVNLVVTYAGGWGIPPAAVTALVARRAQFEPLFATAQNKTRRNRGDVIAFRECRDIYEKEIRAFVKAYLAANPLVTDQQRMDMALTVRDTEPTPRGKIHEFPFVLVTSSGGGEVQVRARVEEDRTRASMHPLADAIECRWTLVPKGEMPPEGHEDAKNVLVSKKALFTIECGDKNSGESFWGFFRWVNESNPAMSGKWTKPLKVVIG